jgi:hypothetical protein
VLRWILLLVIATSLAVCGATVKLGKRTFFGHVRAIWATEEVQDARDGIKEKAGPAVDDVRHKAGPAVDRAKRAGKKALDEMTRDAPDAGAPR